MGLAAAINNVTTTAPSAIKAEAAEIQINTLRMDRVIEERKNYVSSDIKNEEIAKKVIALPERMNVNNMPGMNSSSGIMGGLSATATASTIQRPYSMYSQPQQLSVEDKLKLEIDAKIKSIKEEAVKQVSKEKTKITDKKSSKFALELKIVGAEALAKTTELLIKDALFYNKNR